MENDFHSVDLLQEPHHRFFSLERPMYTSDKLNGIKRFIWRKKYPEAAQLFTRHNTSTINHNGNNNNESSPSKSLSKLSNSTDGTKKEDKSIEQIEMDHDSIVQKIEELKKQKRDCFNLFRQLINSEGEKKKQQPPQISLSEKKPDSPVLSQANSRISTSSTSNTHTLDSNIQISTTTTAETPLKIYKPHASPPLYNNHHSSSAYNEDLPGEDRMLVDESPRSTRSNTPRTSPVISISTTRPIPVQAVPPPLSTSSTVYESSPAPTIERKFETKIDSTGRETRYGLASSFYPATSRLANSAKYHPYVRGSSTTPIASSAAIDRPYDRDGSVGTRTPSLPLDRNSDRDKEGREYRESSVGRYAAPPPPISSSSADKERGGVVGDRYPSSNTYERDSKFHYNSNYNNYHHHHHHMYQQQYDRDRSAPSPHDRDRVQAGFERDVTGASSSGRYGPHPSSKYYRQDRQPPPSSSSSTMPPYQTERGYYNNNRGYVPRSRGDGVSDAPRGNRPPPSYPHTSNNYTRGSGGEVLPRGELPRDDYRRGSSSSNNQQ